jgi:hypothetical protein
MTYQPSHTIDAAALVGAFDKAKSAGLKRPKMRFEHFTASLAPDTGRNPGAIYLKAKSNGEYLGMIAEGRFKPAFTCTDGAREAVMAAMADPLEQAIAYGRKTGECSCCGRTLSDPESVERGIGPICATKFGL